MESNVTFYVVEVFLELALSYRLGYKDKDSTPARSTFLYRLNITIPSLSLSRQGGIAQH
jgi:hypothetical protein